MKCTITDVQQDVACSWCSKKTDVVCASIESTFFVRSNLCWKCFRKSLELRKRQELISAKSNSKPTGQSPVSAT